MNAILILDKDGKTGLSEDLKERILRILKEKAHRVEVVELGRNDATPCLGCFLCITTSMEAFEGKKLPRGFS